MPKRLTYEHVKNFIESKGYTLLDKVYKNVKSKLNVSCPEGHEYKVTFYSFRQGHRCAKCQNVKNIHMKRSNLLLNLKDILY